MESRSKKTKKEEEKEEVVHLPTINRRSLELLKKLRASDSVFDLLVQKTTWKQKEISQLKTEILFPPFPPFVLHRAITKDVFLTHVAKHLDLPSLICLSLVDKRTYLVLLHFFAFQMKTEQDPAPHPIEAKYKYLQRARASSREFNCKCWKCSSFLQNLSYREEQRVFVEDKEGQTPGQLVALMNRKRLLEMPVVRDAVPQNALTLDCLVISGKCGTCVSEEIIYVGKKCCSMMIDSGYLEEELKKNSILICERCDRLHCPFCNASDNKLICKCKQGPMVCGSCLVQTKGVGAVTSCHKCNVKCHDMVQGFMRGLPGGICVQSVLCSDCHQNFCTDCALPCACQGGLCFECMPEDHLCISCFMPTCIGCDCDIEDQMEALWYAHPFFEHF